MLYGQVFVCLNPLFRCILVRPENFSERIYFGKFIFVIGTELFGDAQLRFVEGNDLTEEGGTFFFAYFPLERILHQV